MLKEKKSAIDLTELAIGVVILGVIVSVGATVLITTINAQVENLPNYRVNNETVTTVNQLGDNLAVQWVKSIDFVHNASSTTILNSGNYTSSINSGNGIGTIFATSTSNFNGTSWNVSYTVYNISDARYTLPNQAAVGISEYGNWFKILVIVGISAVVLSLIYLAFGKSSQDSGVGY